MSQPDSTQLSASSFPFEAPLPPQASEALSAVLSQGPDADLGRLMTLTEARLGSAAGLFRALRLKHPVTANHSMRVALGCSVFLNELDVDELTRQQIELAALLHDIGKLAIPDDLLNKVEPLNQSEQAILNRHLELAIHIITPFCSDQMIIDNIRYAGNWYDGRNDTEFVGSAIPLGARVLAIQNAYDAMTTDMIYRDALPREQAMAELCQNAGTQFDPELVAQFVSMQADADTQYYTDAIRRWADTTQNDVDMLWTLATPIDAANGDTRAIFQKRLLESMNDGVAFFDIMGRVIIWNRGAAELTGLSREGVQYKQWKPSVVDMRDMEGNTTKMHNCPVRDCLLTASEFQKRLQITHRQTDRKIAVEVHLMPVRDTSGTMYGAIMILHDASSEYNLEETVQTLHSKATRDGLTGVNNRAEFDRRHFEMVGDFAVSGEPLSLIICDIDRFKSINDKYGHQAGDEALISFAKHISSYSRDGDIVARYGGEEFVVICPNCDMKGAVKKADSIRKTLASTPQSSLKGTVMTASFGVSQFQPGDTAETMLKRADAALYAAKEGGRNRVHFGNERLSDSTALRDVTETWTWFGRKEKRAKEELLWQHDLLSSVPTEVLIEKIRGFVDEGDAEVVSSSNRQIVLRVDESAFNNHRRQSERPVVLTMNINLDYDVDESRSEIEVKFFFKRGRERRVDEILERAQWLTGEFKRYLMAEDA